MTLGPAELTENDLKKLGVPFGHRKLLEAIAGLAAAENAKVATGFPRQPVLRKTPPNAAKSQ